MMNIPLFKFVFPMTAPMVKTMALSHLPTVSKGTALSEEDQGKKNMVPGKRGVTASVNSRSILGSAWSYRGAPPRPAFCHYGDGRFITLVDGKSLEDWQVVHRSMAQLPRRGAASLITQTYTNNTHWKTHRPLLVMGWTVEVSEVKLHVKTHGGIHSCTYIVHIQT